MSGDPLRRKAVEMLVLATALWGLSFPVMKCLALVQQELLPGRGSLFLASLTAVVRFGLSAAGMVFVCRRTLRSFTRSEWHQGLGLGFFTGLGILFQMDGLAHTSASTSAFLTQASCLFVPAWVACRDRRLPGGWTLLGVLLAAAGVSILSGFDPRTLRIGRGEAETLLSALLFTGQILILARPDYRHNNMEHVSLIMFAVMALLGLPPVIWLAQEPADLWNAWRSGSAIALLLVVVVACTFGAFRMVNHWQRHLTATQAGIIYCSEPVFASLYALFLPALLAAATHVHYPNEQITGSLLAGGLLIVSANLLTQLPQPPSRTPPTPGS